MVNMAVVVGEEAEVCVAIHITESNSDGVPVNHYLSVCRVQGAGMSNLP